MEFELDKVIDARKYSLHAKATVQQTGKLGFSSEAAILMELKENAGNRIVFMEIGSGDFSAVIFGNNEERGFKIFKGGEYYYLNLRQYFCASGLDYQNNRVIYDISATDSTFDGRTVYFFKRRMLPIKDKTKNTNNGLEI